MPKATVTQAFHYAQGGTTLRITKGDHDDLSERVIAHGIKLGFIPEPKQPKAQPPAKQVVAADADAKN